MTDKNSRRDTSAYPSQTGVNVVMPMSEVVQEYRDIGYNEIIDGLSDQLMVISPDYRILFANQAFLDFHRKTLAQVTGQRCYCLSHGLESPCPVPEHECPLLAVLQTEKSLVVTHKHISHTGETENAIYVSISASPIKDSLGNVVAVIELMHDITKAKLIEMQLENTYRGLLALGSLSSVISQSLNLNVVLDNALEMLLEFFKTDLGGILLYEEDKKMLCYRAHRGFSSRYIDKTCYPLGEDINGYVFNTGEIVLAEDVMNDPRTISSALIEAEKIMSFVGVPLVAKGEKLGVLHIASRKLRKFSNEDIRFLASAVPQIALAVENAILHREVEYKEEVRGDLLKEILNIQEEERRRIARELHDETSQSLASLSATLEVVLQTPGNQAKSRELVKKAQLAAVGILNEIHRIIYELRPSILDDLGLIPAVRWLENTMLEEKGIHVKLKTSGRARKLPSDSEASLYRVIQEALTNIARHSNAKNALISIKFAKDDISVNISDDGSGFDFDSIINSIKGTRGLGLLGMKERIEFMGGELIIKSQPGQGTEISIVIPFTCPVPMNSHHAHG